MEIPNKNIIRSSGFINKIRSTNDRIINYVIAITLLFSIPAIVGMYIRSRNSNLESLFCPQFFLAFLLFAIYIIMSPLTIRSKERAGEEWSISELIQNKNLQRLAYYISYQNNIGQTSI